MTYIFIKTSNKTFEVMAELPFDLKVNDGMLSASLLVATLVGMALIYQGSTGVRTCDNPTLHLAKRHASRAKRALMVFAVLFLVKIFVDIGFIADFSDSIESQMDKVPKLVEEHNKGSNDPHIVLLYRNGTALFEDKPLLQPLNHPEFPCSKGANAKLPEDCIKYEKLKEENVNLEKRERHGMHKQGRRHDWQGPHKRHQKPPMRHRSYYRYNIGKIIDYDSETNVLKIKIDKLQGHVKEIIIGFYCFAAVVEVLLLAAMCACILRCNSKYRQSCEKYVKARNGQRPAAAQNEGSSSESQVELVSYSAN